jgi:putative ABC transport system permease protein
MIFAVPLAWLQLTYEKSRLLVAIAGITFAVILIFMQIGFQDALFRSAIRLQSSLNGDLVIINPQSTNLVGMRNFSQRRLYQTLNYEGVEKINPLYIGLAAWKIKESQAGQTRNILVLGADPDAQIFKMPGVDFNLASLKLADVVLFDRSSRPEFGAIADECGITKPLKTQYTSAAFQCEKIVAREVANRKITVGGLFELGSSFAADGAMITSDLNFLRIFDTRRPGLINVGLIDLKTNASPYAVMAKFVEDMPGKEVVLVKGNLKIDNLKYRTFPTDPDKVIITKSDLTIADIEASGGKDGAADITVDDTRILTMNGFINFERIYWQRGTAIGFIFTLGTIMGFIVGIVIVYQILYTDVSDHMAEYATLKAMGYSNFYLSKIVIQEAIVLSILGYIPGLIIGNGLYALTRNATRLPIEMTLNRMIEVLILTLIMCTISGIISLRKVQSADPAEMFT